MKYYLILCLPLVSNFVASFKPTDTTNGMQIIGGHEASEGMFPYQCSLRKKGSHWCGGSPLNSEWVLTAAHCIKRGKPSLFTLVCGSTNLSSGGDVYAVRELHTHENPDVHDVGLLKVDRITFTGRVQPVRVETEDVGGGVNVTLTGWGYTYPQKRTVPDKLQYINLKTITKDECKKRVFSASSVSDSDICTLTKKGEGACSGDSGGPLVTYDAHGPKQCGIVSWGVPCAVGYPDVYKKVSFYIGWLESTCNCKLLK